ncbi:nuclease-related domain-containing protein [Ramlibacter tataouinensis]|uniref:nuclease-related domain-containing protein n=1 Tax=Ramlibacter tataouinensis TaxID=94132 RepID=UPI0022F3DF72|nr:nuclease-related domain-containing protein [Ramlibacter tataouinensis]WBY01418.1 nuclease-related domain-containing protein [Ramlibacter tataouinensis]
MLDYRQKQWLREELGRLRKGIQGERDSAYYLDQYFKDSENHVVLHDLRFVFEGDVAQIDHLVISRALGIYLIETKNYAGNVSINAHGEFTVDYDGDRFGVPSPIEQSHRHERVLLRLMDRLGIEARIGGAMQCHHVVMFNPKSIITRPKPSEFDTRNVIKADQFPSWREQYVDREVGGAKIFKAIANLRSLETIKEWGEKLIRQHRPGNLLDLPEFMQVKKVRGKTKPDPKSTDFIQIPVAETVLPAAGNSGENGSGEKRLICLHCNEKISFAEGRFCWNNAPRFKGGQYCREHQARF